MSLSASSPARPLLHGIQAVRGLFAVLVVCHHIGVQSAHYFGHDWMGGFFNQSTYRVDFFFVLSGFVLWTAHQAEAGRPGAWLGFLGKRLWRLYPLLVVLTLLKVLLLWLIPGRDAGSYNLLPSLLALPQNSFPVIVAAWFLPFEIYFVTALAACLALPRRASLPALVTWAVMLSAAGFFLGIRPSIHGVGFLIHPFVLEFAAGALAAECVRRQSGGRRPLGMLLCGVALGGLVFGASNHAWINASSVVWPKLFWAAVFAIGLAGLALWERSVALQNWHLKDFLWVGRSSYSIFLSHGIVLTGFFSLMRPRILGLNGIWLDGLLLLMVPASVLVGVVVWKCLERPLARCNFSFWVNGFKAQIIDKTASGSAGGEGGASTTP